jgi:hypothetical protein
MSSSFRSRWIPALAAVLLTLAPASVSATPTEKDKADAKTAYTEARVAAAAGRHADAVKAFKRSQDLDPNPQTQLEMAKSLQAEGKLLEASKTLNEIINANPPVIWPVKSAAQKTLSELEPRIPWIQIKVIGPEQKLTSTTIDGKEVDAENEVPWDPGERVIAADADGYEPAEKTITLAEGAHEVVELTLARTGGAKPAGPSGGDTSTNTTTSGGGGGGGRSGGGGDILSGPFFIPMVVGFGVGVVGLGMGTAFGVMALNSAAEAKEDCNGNTCPDTVRVRRARDAAIVSGNVSTATFIIGGVGIAAGAAMLILNLTSSPPPPKKEQAFVRPYIGAGEAGVYGAF